MNSVNTNSIDVDGVWLNRSYTGSLGIWQEECSLQLDWLMGRVSQLA